VIKKEIGIVMKIKFCEKNRREREKQKQIERGKRFQKSKGR
jgi:hypothetical protein